MPPSCPRCQSSHVLVRRIGESTGGVLGMTAGAATGASSAFISGAEAGALIGTAAGPVGTFSGAILGALAAGTAGFIAGAKLGQLVDQTILGRYQCVHCRHTFSDDSL